MLEKAPLKFHPYLKTVIWGGEKICEYKGIESAGPTIGESWEISMVPGHESVVATGTYEGKTIAELINAFSEELLGEKVVKKYGNTFPLLVKLIDANDNLSVQVHPDDNLAKERHGCQGKTEMWYIIDAEKGATIFAGLCKTMTPEEYRQRIADNTIMETLASHSSEPGDVFYLPAGRVHAIGAGNLLAEIQETSDITYRIYDYDRRDKDGNPRELHTELAVDAIDYKVYDNYKNPHDTEQEDEITLADCEHFITKRVLMKGETEFDLDGESFTILMCITGEGEIEYGKEKMGIKQGETVLLPATMKKFKVNGVGKLLVARAGK